MRGKAVAWWMLLFAVPLLLCCPLQARAEQELIVSAAASLTNAFQEIIQKFQEANTGVRVIPNFAASGVLLQQMEKGAPVDVFASADQKTMDQAVEKKLVLTETRKDFVSNQLVLIVPMESKLPIKGLQDLTMKEVTKVTMGNPETVPAGRYAQEVLTNEGLWDTLKPKYINAETVRQALDYVSRGEVDAGITFSTDAVVAKSKVRVVCRLEKHKPIRYPIAVVVGTQKKEPAQRFIDYVLSPEGQQILAKHGFEKP
ncbi:MAG: molybdate ABC transporter substrate-binding protein [Deltaproteobacteria bacterium]|jgi:molybdate transport system substrate-binding protein|nr:molybdate ABC transporter substrate-binding protein [Deltaproteobacteria bacterium]